MDSVFRKLNNIVNGIIKGDYSIIYEKVEEKIETSIDFLQPSKKPDIFIDVYGESLSIEEISRIVKILLDEKKIEFLLSPEGQLSEKNKLANQTYLGAINPDFTPIHAQKLADEHFKPFDKAIKILEQNGYEVSLKKES
jgi:hypothetical protein